MKNLNLCRIGLLVIASGTLLCTCRESKPHEKRGVGLSYSLDGGVTWVEQTLLYRAAASPDCGYPSMVAPGDNAVFCAYYTETIDDACHLEGAFLQEGTDE